MDDDSNVFQAVPKPIVQRLAAEGAPPPSGRGRLRVDFSISFGNILTIILILGGLLIAGDRIKTETEITRRLLAGHLRQSEVYVKELIRQREELLELRRDLKNFPLHKHVDHNRTEIFPDESVGRSRDLPGIVAPAPLDDEK